MKRTEGNNVKIMRDETGAFISVDWVCPYCEFENAGLYATDLIDVLDGDFEMDEECLGCGETATIECRDAEFDD